MSSTRLPNRPRHSASSSVLRPLLLAAVVLLSGLMPARAEAVEGLDLSSPEGALKAMRKLHCSLVDGEPAIYYWSGNVYSRVPGERDRRLFTYEAINIRACKTLSEPERGPGYRLVSREILVYLDPRTREVVRTWKNPWTGEDLEVVHIANDPVNHSLYANGPRGPFRFNASFKEGRGWMGFEVPLFYPNPLAGEYQEYVGGTYQAIEMFNFFFEEAPLLDVSVPRLDNAFVGWSRVSKWLPWMKMGDRAGQMMYNGSGKRVAGFDALPEVLRREIDESFPKFRNPPSVDDERPNQTSWSYFKKRVDEERAAEARKE